MPCKGHHGQRVVDAQVYSARSRFLRAVREYFLAENFLEVDTPVLLPWAPAEPYLTPFEMEYAGRPAYLATSPEFGLKTVWACCTEEPVLEKIFEISHSFRREEHSSAIHTLEFLMLEWYDYRADLFEMIERFRGLWNRLAKLLGAEVNQEPPQSFSIEEAMAEHQGLQIDDPDSWIAYAKRSAGTDTEHPNIWDSFSLFFLKEVEPRLCAENRLWAVSGFPAALGAMARRRGAVAERVEIYYSGLELANIYLEETDPVALIDGWQADNRVRRETGRPERPLPEPFLEDWARLHDGRKNGSDQGCGAALGLDRLFMLLSGATTLASISPYSRF